MDKKLLTILLMLSTFLMNGQQITFQKNVNYKARILQQKLNKDKDSLILSSKTASISQVDIFNETYSRQISVNSSSTAIDLKELPVGNFIVQAQVNKKWIVMYLQKKPAAVTAMRSDKKSLYYWVVLESNSNFGSRKSMKLEHKDRVAKLITKNQLELKSKVGKDNTLQVYPVYDKSEFMNMQSRNSNYYQSVENSKYFDSEPLYDSNEYLKSDTHLESI
ncbi:hypothetical protein AB9K26_04385 [Psychroserpens sp. XS_ASV72]|uniref:hypothetical protein n=1 Tax=Psychroserpens sp. XS_ASV72 TaxID=3241293 RepID=UPI003517D2C2